VRLSDGTRVSLAPESRLTVAADYDRVARTVALEGEAYFIVVHNAARPFVVGAGAAIVRDPGTRFVVRAFGNEPSVRVLVTQGEVRLGLDAIPSDSGPRLSAGDAGRLGAHDVPRVAHRIDTTRFVAWTHG